MEMIEVTANSVDAAISKGLAELNATPGDVMIEVLEEPNTGLFGFGAREARVRIVLIGRRKSESPEEEAEPEADEPEEQDRLPLPKSGKKIWMKTPSSAGKCSPNFWSACKSRRKSRCIALKTMRMTRRTGCSMSAGRASTA